MWVTIHTYMWFASSSWHRISGTLFIMFSLALFFFEKLFIVSDKKLLATGDGAMLSSPFWIAFKLQMRKKITEIRIHWVLLGVFKRIFTSYIQQIGTWVEVWKSATFQSHQWPNLLFCSFYKFLFHDTTMGCFRFSFTIDKF